MPTTLDDQAKQILHTLKVGGRFTLREGKGLFECASWHHPVECEPYVHAHVVERGGTLGNFRAIRVSRIEAVVSGVT